MARQAKPLDSTRTDQLFTAAAQEFTDLGYEQASLNRILERAAMAKSSFYHYFQDKNGLFDALVRSYATNLNELSECLAPAGRTPEVTHALRELSSRLEHLSGEDPRPSTLGRLLSLPDAPSTPAVVDLRAAFGRRALRALITWRRRGEVSAASPLRLQFAMVLAAVEVADRWVIEQGITATAIAQAEQAIGELLRPASSDA